MSLETRKIDPNALGGSWTQGLTWICFSPHLLALLAPAWPHPQLSYLCKTATNNLNLCFPTLATPWEEDILVSYCLFKKNAE